MHASDFTLEADDERILLSVDLSPNQRVRNKDSNCYHDITELVEKLDRVEYFEFYPEEWLTPLAESVGKHPDASQELEIRFKSERSRTYKGKLRKQGNVLFVVEHREG